MIAYYFFLCESNFYFSHTFRILNLTMLIGWLVTLITCLPALLAWDPSDGDMPWQPEEIAPFELVDEINGTFYELIDISRKA